jgi:predicted nucleic acid-binding protein
MNKLLFSFFVPLLLGASYRTYYQWFHKKKQPMNEFIFELFINPMVKTEIKFWLDNNKNLDKLLDLQIINFSDTDEFMLTYRVYRETYSEAVSIASLLVAMIIMDLSNKTIYSPILSHRVIGTKITTLSKAQHKQYYEAKISISKELTHKEIEQIKLYDSKIILKNNTTIVIARLHNSEYEMMNQTIKNFVKTLEYKYHINYIGYCRYDTSQNNK